jgi:hypothetical protein
MAYFEQVHNIRHIWGVPVTAHFPAPSEKVHPDCLALEESLRWRVCGRIKQIYRCRNFPSWSWTGWHHCIALIEDNNRYRTCSTIDSGGSEFQVQVEIASGQLFHWSEFNQSYTSLNTSVPELSQFLYIRVSTSSLERTSENYGGPKKSTPVVLMCEGQTEIALMADSDEIKSCSEALRSYPLETFLVLHLRLPGHCIILIEIWVIIGNVWQY